MENTRPYRGDPNLKGTGVQIEWSPELIEERLRCRDDIIYFSEKYIKIITEDGLQPIVLRDYQKELILSMQQNRATYALQCRQSGKTEAMRCFALHYIIFNEQKTIALLANKAATAVEILGKIQVAYRHLPLWLQVGVSEWNKGSFVLENGSRILAAATSSDAIRGYTIQCLMLDELAFIENWEEFSASVIPTVSAGKQTKIIMCTTPNGLNHAYKIWKESEEGRNNFYRVFVPWWRVPGRDEQWKQETMALMSHNEQKFSQEHEVEFLGSSATLISGSALKNLVFTTPIQDVEGLAVYENPIAGHTYAICCDVSRGKGLDYSAFSVIDVSTMPYKQICTYRSNVISPTEYADIIYRIGTWYNTAAVLVEINDIGEEVVNLLFENEYENVLYTENAGNKGQRIAINPSKAQRGIRTTTTTKAKGCAVLKLLIEQQQLIINDFQTIEELSRFVRKGRSYEAEQGAHDDTVMPLVLFGWLTTQDFFKALTDINTMAALREKTMQDLEEQMMVIGAYSDGMEDDIPDHVVEVSISEFERFMRDF